MITEGSPLVLQAAATLLPGAVLGVDTELVSTPYREPHWIEEICFHVDGPYAPALAGAWTGGLGGSIACKLALASGRSLTRDWTPIWGFCPNSCESIWAPPPLLQGAFPPYDANDYRWRLDKPLYVPAGDALIPTFQRSVADSAAIVSAVTPITVRITYLGHLQPLGRPAPKFAQVPWVSTWVDVGPAGVPPPVIGTNSEMTLGNPFTIPMRVHRLVGRIWNLWIGGPPFADFDYRGLGVQVQSFQDSHGYSLIKAPMPFNELFDSKRDFLVNADLSPKEYFTITLDNTVPALLQAGTGIAPVAVIPMISIVGWRNEAI